MLTSPMDVLLQFPVRKTKIQKQAFRDAVQVYLHTLRADAQGNTGAALFNPELDFGIALRFNIHQLPCFTQWKMMGVRDYVMGLEPGTCNPVGQTEAKNRGQVIMLEPNAAHEVKISLDILHNSQEMKTFIEKL